MCIWDARKWHLLDRCAPASSLLRVGATCIANRRMFGNLGGCMAGCRNTFDITISYGDHPVLDKGLARWESEWKNCWRLEWTDGGTRGQALSSCCT